MLIRLLGYLCLLQSCTALQLETQSQKFQKKGPFHSYRGPQHWRNNVVVDVLGSEQWMLYILGQEGQEILVDVLVQHLTVHDAAPYDNPLGRESEGNVEAELGQVKPNDLPYFLHVLYFMKFGEIHSCPFRYRPVGNHALKTVIMEWADSLESLILFGVPFYSKLLVLYMICPPSGCVRPWTVMLWLMTPTPTPVPTVTYTSDQRTLWLASRNSAQAAAFTSVSMQNYLQLIFDFRKVRTGVSLHPSLGVEVMQPYLGLPLFNSRGPKHEMPTKYIFSVSERVSLTALAISVRVSSGRSLTRPLTCLSSLNSIRSPFLSNQGFPKAILQFVPPSSIPTQR